MEESAISSYTSPAEQELTQLTDGGSAGAEVVAGALVMAEDWARAPTAKARRAVVYFILDTGSRDSIERKRQSEGVEINRGIGELEYE